MEASVNPIQPREDGNAQELIRRFERKQASEKSATEASEKKALDEYGKKVGS